MAAAAHGAAAGSVPVVLAVDSSRSLSRSDLTGAVESLRAMVRQLPADTPVGAIEFGDTTRWLARPGPARDVAVRALGDIEPRGRFTLLNDALFETAKALPQGGVVVLASDGRDENSATTTDDVARICTANGVHVVTLGVGRRVDERALRRLALLTDGTHVGPQPFASAADLLIAVERARRTTAEVMAKAAPPPAPAPRRTPVPTPTAAPADAGVTIPALVSVVLALAAIATATSILLWRRQRREERRTCEHCGLPLEPWDESCPQCRAEADRADSEIRERQDRENLAQAVAQAQPPEPAPPAAMLDPELLARTPLDEPLDKTFVFGEQFVVVVKEPRKAARTLPLAPDTPFTVGRAHKVNTVVIADPTMSAQHFRIACKEGDYYIADLETTNGTTVNGERVRVRKLQVGDRIRAGEVEFEFRVHLTVAGRPAGGLPSP
jgi:hypothetical protein